MLLGTLSASLVGNILAGKKAIAKRKGRGDKFKELLELAMDQRDLRSKRIFNAATSFN